MRNLLFILLSIVILSCDGYGEKVHYDGTDVYYKEPVTKIMADATGAYLKEMGFTDGSGKSVQLTKDSIQRFRMVVQEGIAESKTKDVNFMALGFLLSKKVFNGEAIAFDLCDNTFTTLRTIDIASSSGDEETHSDKEN